MSKYEVFSRPKTRKYGPEKNPCLDTFHGVDDSEDDSALKVAWQISFRGLVAYKPVAYKTVAYEKKLYPHISNWSIFLEVKPQHKSDKWRCFCEKHERRIKIWRKMKTNHI